MVYLQGIKNKTLNFLSRKMSGHILLYHACYPEIPGDLSKNLHNVKPDALYSQLKWYKEHFDMVPLSEWFESSDRRGLATVTFDDAYSSFYDYGLDILESLEIPATVFVIGSTLKGKVFWRDKIRFIESRDLTKDFVKFLRDENADAGITSRNFYEYSKKDDFTSVTPNDKLDKLIDRFLYSRRLADNLQNFCADDINRLSKHPLLTYGNHTTNHYILHTLEDDDIILEVKKCDEQLRACQGIDLSKYFSVPFGGEENLTPALSKVLIELGYKGILLSTNRINKFGRISDYNGLKVANRYLMPESKDEMIQKINHMTYREIR
jgi:peptidoglycan/xylan/chitin deacetylase (PgdA/CDA1 family)